MTTEIRYQIYHNVDAHWMRGHHPNDRLIAGYAASVNDEGDPQHTLANIWARHNDDDRPDGQTAPSLSIGDVVTLGPTATSASTVWTAVSIGWTRTAIIAPTLPGPYNELIGTLERTDR